MTWSYNLNSFKKIPGFISGCFYFKDLFSEELYEYMFCYTATRLPIQLIFVKEFPSRDEAFRFERQIKGWSRVKKEALISGGFEAVKALSKVKK